MTDAELEQRLRRALVARAAAVTAQDLRPVVAERRRARMRWWMPFSAGLAAAAVVTLIFVVFQRPDDPARPDRPIAPAASVPAASDPATSVPTASVPASKPTSSSMVSGTAKPIPSPNAATAAPDTVSSATTAVPVGPVFPSTTEAGR